MAFSDLQLKVAAEASIIAGKAGFAKLNVFAHDYQELDGRKGEAIAIPVIDLSAPGEFDADSNNYCGGENEVDGITLNLDKHFVKSVMITDRQLAATDFNWLKDIATAETDALVREVNKYVFGLINATNCPLSAELDTTTKAGIASLYATAEDNDIDPGQTVLVLDPKNFANVLANIGDSQIYGGTEAIRLGVVPGLYGFKAVVCSPYLPDGLNGALVAKDAIGIASRWLEPMAGAYPDAWKAFDGDSAVIGFRHFQNLCSGRRYLAAECLVGAKVLQPKQVVRLIEGE